MPNALDRLASGLEASPLVRYFARMWDDHSDLFMKNLTVDAVGPDRAVKLDGRWVTNFGSDSFLGLDRDPRVLAALRGGIDRWGAHNGSSRAFSSVASNVDAERKLAAWMGTEAAVIYPSVTLANHGILPALVTRRDALVVDQYAHNSVQQGAKLVAAAGGKTAVFAHNDPADLVRALQTLRPYRSAVIAVDGLYSMTGTTPPLAAFREIAEAHDAALYVDDAHATGVLGARGRGTVLDALGDYDNTLVVGSLSKALSCFGGYVACTDRVKALLAVRSNPLIFGGPVPPCYLDGICAAVGIVASPEYEAIRRRLADNMGRFLTGTAAAGVPTVGGVGAIAAVVVGEEMATLTAGRALFDAGYYVQSVIFPAVPHGAGLLRVQINANHTPAAVDGLVAAVARLPAATTARSRVAARAVAQAA